MTYKKLIAGFHQFKETYFNSNKRVDYKKLVEEGQTPETLVIACSDSRIDPAIVTSSSPGEFFAVRNVGALVPPYDNGGMLHGTSSAIGYAVRILKVKHVVVFGHAHCGGVEALANREGRAYGEYEFLDGWLSIGQEAKDEVDKRLEKHSPPQKIIALEQAVIVASLENLLTFPWLREAYERGDLELHGWYFDLTQG